ncbi:hypothetical protein PBI_SCTP2_303 [Salicola phage SCTP-2]|nr:hypothetical protein PBI_SCTP2_303 [Salicola phage SCTP-2]
MNRYMVLQVKLNSEIRNRVNKLGWDGAIEEIPKVKTYLDVTHKGSEAFEKTMSSDYEIVGFVFGDNLEDACRRSNLGYTSCIDNFTGNMHSLSVGDILVESSESIWMVDQFGFSKVEIRHKD